MATVESPPTIPAVYQAALISKGPPKKARGATTAPMTPSQRKTKQHSKICNSSGKNNTCQNNFYFFFFYSQITWLKLIYLHDKIPTHLIVHLSRREYNKLATLSSMTSFCLALESTSRSWSLEERLTKVNISTCSKQSW